MEKEGVIKFKYKWTETNLVDFEYFESINFWRNRLFELGLIGVDDNNIGFGNLSSRFTGNQFIITGSGTGKIKTLTKDHYSLVSAFSAEANFIEVRGPVKASSESLTHAALYQCDGNINSVIHIHHAGLWKHYFGVLPTSDMSIEYGTPAIAMEVKNLALNSTLIKDKILIMGGHQDGIITFGNSTEEAGKILLDILIQFNGSA